MLMMGGIAFFMPWRRMMSRSDNPLARRAVM